MKVVPGSGLVPCRTWLFGVLVPLILTACATTGPVRDARPPDETVDVGYGGVDKDHFAGSAATVGAGDEDAPPFRTLAEMLSRVPGVRVIERPGGGMSVRIRGPSSILADEEPLFVIDGMVLQASSQGLSAINPSTIQSITVLKNAGQTAVYGSRGANGVILIKTKRGPGSDPELPGVVTLPR